MTDRFPLRLLAGEMAVCRLGPTEPAPGWASGPPFSCVLRTPHELSVVCAAPNVPPDVRHESGWRAFELVGPVPFTTTGVVSSLAAPLAEAGIGIFVLSTFDTDYLLVKQGALLDAVGVLRKAGFVVNGVVPA